MGKFRKKSFINYKLLYLQGKSGDQNPLKITGSNLKSQMSSENLNN